MKIALVVILFAALAHSQDPSTVSPAQSACGPKQTRFSVKSDPTAHSVVEPEAGKATLYLIKDAGTATAIFEGWTVKMVLDGEWAGANQRNSFFSLSLDPGEHHLCASWKSRLDYLSRIVSLAHFTAEAGKVYYFRTRIVSGGHRIFPGSRSDRQRPRETADRIVRDEYFDGETIGFTDSAEVTDAIYGRQREAC